MKLRFAGWASALAALLSCMPALAATITFEPPTYSVGTGQACSSIGTEGGWSVSSGVSNGVSAQVCNYAAARSIIPFLDGGGTQFAAAANTPTGKVTFSQYGVDFTDAAIWSVSYDMLVLNLSGAATSTDPMIGSFGLMGPSGGSLNAFELWDSTAPGSTFTAYYGFNLNGLGETFPVAGAAWQNLQQGHWYRESMVFDIVTDSVLSVSITDLTGGTTSTVEPTGWYLWPQDVPGAGAPSNLRLYGIGASNVLAFDNIEVDVAPEPSTLLLAALGLAAAAVCRRRS
jgi:hypothetical protein